MSEEGASASHLNGTDYDRLLRSNLERVFNERDAERRAAALAELYVDEPVMYEPEGVVQGRAAISEIAGKLLEQFGATFSFTPQGVAVGHHGLGVLNWRGGSDDAGVMVTGADAAEIVDGKIARLWVLINAPGA